MKLVLSLATGLMLVTVAAAQTRAPLLEYVCNSAGAPGGTATANADVSDRGEDATSARLYYSTDGQGTWTEAPMDRPGEPGFDSTFAASFGLPGAGTVWYYINADNGQGFGTQAPYNSGNSWPPGDNLLARAALDDTGDTNNGEGPFLDLTGAFVGRSGDRFYCTLTNNGGGWPTSGGILKWYAYSLGFANPEASSDSWVFGPIYVSAWPVLEHGLFAINRYTGATPERVGDIDYQTDGNRLAMRCLISDLAGDPRFGPWPNDCGWLWAGASTLSITPGGSTTRDTTFPGRAHLDRTPRFVINQNATPELSRPRVLPDTGTADTSFWFNVLYSDADTNLPVLRAVVVDDVDTVSLQPSSHRYWQNVSYGAYRSGFGPGWHSARFVFNDGMAEVTATDSFYVVGLTLGEHGWSSRFRLSARPNPFRSRVELERGPGVPVEIRDAAGRVVRVLGPGEPTWDGRDPMGFALGTGVFFALIPGETGTGLRLVKTR